MRKGWQGVMAGIALVVSGWLHAGVLVQYSYTDPYDQEKTATPTTAAVNPVGEMRFILAAGIDRKLRITLYRGSTPLGTAESPPLTGDDRISVGGETYYGATLALAAPALDGSHTLRAEILSYAGTLITREDTAVIIDRQPPVMSGGFAYLGGWPNNHDPLTSGSLVSGWAVARITARSVTDAHAGLATDGARFQTIYLEGPNSGQVAYETPAVFSGTDLVVGSGSENSVVRGTHLPYWEGNLLLRFVAFDQAGNAASFDLPVLYDGLYTSDGVEIFAVYNPASSANPVPGSPFVGYDLYMPGMTVHTNPVKLLVRAPKTAWWEYNPTGIMLYAQGRDPWPTPADYTDATHAYKTYDFSYRPVAEIVALHGLSPDFRVAAPMVWSVDSPASVRPHVILAAGVPPSPVYTGAAIEYATAGAVPFNEYGTSYLSTQVDTLTRVTLSAAARPYDQSFTYWPDGTCTIPAGATSCSIYPNRVFGDTADGMEALGYEVILTNSDRTLKAPITWTTHRHDTRPPVITALTLTDENREVEVRLTEYLTGAWWSSVNLDRVWGEAVPAGGGTPVTLDSTLLRSLGGDDWQARLPLSGLPEGEYTLTVHAEDYYGNRAAPAEIAVIADQTPPTAAFFGEGGVVLGSAPVADIGDIYFSVTDGTDPNPQVLSASISGGPLGDDVNLGFYRKSGVYRIEYPVMLPSLAADDYLLTVTLRDAYGNEGTAQQTFTFDPPRLDLTAENRPHVRLPLLAEAVPVRLANDNWPLTTDPAVLADAGGLPLSGTANLLVAWSADALSALVIDGHRLEPGTRLTLPDYDFTRFKGRITLPVALADSTGLAPGWVGDLIVQIERPEAPVLVTAVHAWSPATALVMMADEPAYARKVQTANLEVKDSGAGYCSRVEGLATAGETRPTSNAEGTYRCAVLWPELPASLAVSPVRSALLTGFLDSTDDAVTLEYQPGLQVVSDGVSRFIPGTATQTTTLTLFDPEPPDLSFAPISTLARFTEWLPAGVWPTTPGLKMAGVAQAKSTPYTGVTLQITDAASGQVIDEIRSTTDYARGPIRTELARVEDEQTIQLRAAYTRYPEIFSEGSARFSALPERMLLQLVKPRQASNRAPIVLEGYFGQYAAGAYTFNAESMGNWRVQLYHVTRDAEGAVQRTPLGAPVTTFAADGGFAIDLGLQPPGRLRLEATATFVGTAFTMADALRALPLTLQVEDGTPVTCTVVPQAPHGQENHVAILKLEPGNSRYADIGAVVWERSPDQNTWTPVTLTPPRPRAYGFNERLTTPGHYYYRATTTNRHSGEQATCVPGHIQIYAQPEVTLDGHTFTFVDHPVTWSARPADGSAPLDYRWRVRRGLKDESPMTGTAASLVLPADLIGTWYVELQARFTDAPDTPRAWATVRGTLRVNTPRLVAPRISGERIVELGKSYTYTAETFPITYPHYSLPDDLYVTGEWVLPDGTTHSGATLTYTPTSGDRHNLVYRAWVNGFREETQREAEVTLRTWVYAFPTFTLQAKIVKHYDPVRKQYAVRQSGGTTGEEDFTYTWSFPMAATADQPHERYATAAFSAVGRHTVTVRVSDTRGNAVVLSDDVVVAEPPPLTASSRILVGDSFQRAPAPVTIYWYAGGLLTQERVTAVQLRVDGQLVGQGMNSYYRTDVAAPGTHQVAVDLTTDYGRSATHHASFDLVTGMPPDCTLAPTGDGETALNVKLACAVPMGRIASYRWQVTYADAPGQPVDPGLNSYSALTFSPAQLARGVQRVEGVAINDKGQESAAAVWTP